MSRLAALGAVLSALLLAAPGSVPPAPGVPPVAVTVDGVVVRVTTPAPPIVTWGPDSVLIRWSPATRTTTAGPPPPGPSPDAGLGGGATTGPTPPPPAPGPGSGSGPAANDTGTTGPPAADPLAGLATAANAARVAAGLDPLKRDAKLDAFESEWIAIVAARDLMAGGRVDLAHGVGAEAFAARFAARWPTAAGHEIIAFRGDEDGPAVVGQWLDSPTHRRYLLDAGSSHFGVGRAKSASGKWYYGLVNFRKRADQ